MRKIFFAIFVAITMISVYAGEVEIKVYQTSDVHGSYFPYDFITDEHTSGSLARVSTVIRQAREKYGENVLLFDNGDILQGQPTVYYYNYVDTVSPILHQR